MWVFAKLLKDTWNLFDLVIKFFNFHYDLLTSETLWTMRRCDLKPDHLAVIDLYFWKSECQKNACQPYLKIHRQIPFVVKAVVGGMSSQPFHAGLGATLSLEFPDEIHTGGVFLQGQKEHSDHTKAPSKRGRPLPIQQNSWIMLQLSSRFRMGWHCPPSSHPTRLRAWAAVKPKPNSTESVTLW